jgi:hypothetical protein
MSATNLKIVVPSSLDPSVEQWSEDDVEMFLMANMEKYKFRDTAIQALKTQEVHGSILLTLDAVTLDRSKFGLLAGPAICIEMLVKDLKVAKGLVPGK